MSTDFDEFYRSTRNRVLRCTYALSGDLGEAQDAVQEAYVRAWQKWSQLGGYEDPESWVRTVAWRIAVSRWRRARTRAASHLRHGLGPAPQPPDEDTVALVTALRSITAEQRQAIVLHHLVGRSVAEIAAETGVAVGTVKARLSRGRRALADLLRIEMEEPSHA